MILGAVRSEKSSGIGNSQEQKRLLHRLSGEFFRPDLDLPVILLTEFSAGGDQVADSEQQLIGAKEFCGMIMNKLL